MTTTTGTDIITREDIPRREDSISSLNPASVVVAATNQARLLMDIVEKTKCYQEISGKKYLQVEAWEIIGAFSQVHAETEYVEPILSEEEVVGYTAKVNLIKADEAVGSAIMPCYFAENCCKGKQAEAKHKAAMSASQTFATSKAYRMNYSYIAILAGYQPTPAEEMLSEAEQAVRTPDRTVDMENWCEEHQTEWFKKGKMRFYAHPIDGTDPVKWCNKNQPQKRGLDAESKLSPEAVEPKSSPTEGKSNGNIHIDMDSLREMLEELQFADAMDHLKKAYGEECPEIKKAGRVSLAIPMMTEEQQREFFEMCNDRIIEERSS